MRVEKTKDVEDRDLKEQTTLPTFRDCCFNVSHMVFGTPDSTAITCSLSLANAKTINNWMDK